MIEEQVSAGATVGLAHPGSMGAAIGAELRRAGHTVLWCPEGRSSATARRAEDAGLEAATLPELVRRADLVLVLCPPAVAESVAAEIAAATMGEAGGIYIEANAITPARVRAIAAELAPRRVVDAAVVGSPPAEGKTPTLYLSGASADTGYVRRVFAGTRVRTRVLGEDVGQASALKLSYTAYQKASRVLAALAYGAARAHDVDDELLEIAARRSGSYLSEVDYIATTAARAWRWQGEIEDAADLLADAGLPDTMVRAAAGALDRWVDSKDTVLSVEDALARLTTWPGMDQPR